MISPSKPFALRAGSGQAETPGEGAPDGVDRLTVAQNDLLARILPQASCGVKEKSYYKLW